MTKSILIPTAIGLAAAQSLSALTILSDDHADLGIAFEGGAWDLHVGIDDELNPGGHLELEASDTLFFGDDSIQLTPTNSGSFLYNSGNPIWVFPESEQVGALFLGIATEEVDGADFVGDLTLSLANATGPGAFVLYSFDTFGSPVVYMDTRDGIDASDNVALSTGSHGHYNWAFFEQGLYDLGFQASGILNDGENTLSISDPTAFQFGINQVPEPSVYALGLGSLALLFAVRQKQRRK